VQCVKQVASLESSVLQHNRRGAARKSRVLPLISGERSDYAIIFLLDGTYQLGRERMGGRVMVNRLVHFQNRRVRIRRNFRTARRSGFDELGIRGWHRFWASGVVTALRDEAGTLRGFAR